MDINNINYLTFEGGGGKGTIYLSTIMLLILLLVCTISCNAQTSNQDSLAEEFKLIDVLIPENLEIITPESIKKTLISKNIIVTEYPTKYEYTEIIPIVFQDHTDSVKSKLNDYYLVANKVDSVKSFSINAYYYFSENKDSLNSIRIEISNKIISSDKTYQDNDTYLTLFEYIKNIIIIKYINTLNLPIEIKDNTYMDFDDEIINSCFWSFKNDNGFINIDYNKKKDNTVWDKSITVEINIPLY